MPDDDAPAPPALADALDELAESMREYPDQPTTPEEVVLLHRFADAIRKLTADNARLRHELETAGAASRAVAGTEGGE